VRIHEEKDYAMEVCNCDNLINHIEAAAANTVPRQIVSIRASIQHHYELCVQVEEGHSEHTFSALTRTKYSRRYTLK
jgi:hypothetical protein